MAPVPPGREVDDASGLDASVIVEGEHASRHYLTRPARSFISLEVRRKPLLGLKREALHHANAVDGVNRCFGILDACAALRAVSKLHLSVGDIRFLDVGRFIRDTRRAHHFTSSTRRFFERPPSSVFDAKGE
jgi:hypothetical protein